MTTQTVIGEDYGKVRVLRLNRPERLNALDMSIKENLIQALREAADDDQVAAVVLTGSGRAFSAGADLEMFTGIYERKDQEAMRHFTDLNFPRAFFNFPKPLVAAVNGPAVGWGFTVTLSCDLRLASQDAVFIAGFVRAGVTPEFGSSALLPRIVGLGRALELVLTARKFTAQEALEMGLLSEVTPPEELLDRALKLAEQVIAHSGPALGMAKQLLYAGAEEGVEQTLERELTAFRRAMATPEHYAAVKDLLKIMKDM